MKDIKCNMAIPNGVPPVIQSLHKWVQHNTFVGAHADFHFRIEEANKDPVKIVTQICKVCGLDKVKRAIMEKRSRGGGLDRAMVVNYPASGRLKVQRLYPPALQLGEHAVAPGKESCPTSAEILGIVDNLDKHENHEHTVHQAYSWAELYAKDPDMTTAAMLLAREYGYTDLPAYFEPTAGHIVRCGFTDHQMDAAWRDSITDHLRHGISLKDKGQSRWMCLLDRTG
jgi:hypothetical protein